MTTPRVRRDGAGTRISGWCGGLRPRQGLLGLLAQWTVTPRVLVTSGSGYARGREASVCHYVGFAFPSTYYRPGQLPEQHTVGVVSAGDIGLSASGSGPVTRATSMRGRQVGVRVGADPPTAPALGQSWWWPAPRRGGRTGARRGSPVGFPYRVVGAAVTHMGRDIRSMESIDRAAARPFIRRRAKRIIHSENPFVAELAVRPARYSWPDPLPSPRSPVEPSS